MHIVTSSEINIITFVIAISLSIFLVKIYKGIIINIVIRRFKNAKEKNDKDAMAKLLLVMYKKNLLTKRVKSIAESEINKLSTNDID